MTYQETLDYLFTQLPMYQRTGTSAFKKDLTNIKRLCHALHNPQNTYQTIHVAGTNGKGTVSHMIAAILQEMGFSVGLYTSPHYTDFRERIKVNGKWISEEKVVQWVESHQEIIPDLEPSFFEITVAMAFDYFKNQSVDIAIIETGLGGRLDSTNIITPELSVITQISKDHQNMLGETVYQIASEKAGIIKKEVPVVIGLYQSSCDQVFLNKTRDSKSSLTWASLKWNIEIENSSASLNCEEIKISILNTQNHSPFHIQNTCTALEAIRVYCLSKKQIIQSSTLEKAIHNYATMTNYIGRWQIIKKQPLIIADSAHNEDAIKLVMQRIQAMSYKKLHMVIGIVKNKDLNMILSLLPKQGKYYFVEAQIPRALRSNFLKDEASNFKLFGDNFDTVYEGYQAALSSAQKDDLIYIGGSSFVVGDLLSEQLT